MARTLDHRPLPIADTDHLLASTTIVLGAAGLLALLLGSPQAGALLGAVGLASGLVAQMISRTRGERWVDVTGMLLAVLVLAIAVAQGGLP